MTLWHCNTVTLWHCNTAIQYYVCSSMFCVVVVMFICVLIFMFCRSGNISNTIPARFLSSSYDKFLQFVTEFVSLIAVKTPVNPANTRPPSDQWRLWEQNIELISQTSRFDSIKDQILMIMWHTNTNLREPVQVVLQQI